MKAITIYKASAGTGKTYTLAARYIALLLQDIPASSILAVTFTNKATAEMKQRIIEYLYAIGQSLPEADGVRQTILQFLPAPTPRYPYNQPEFISSQAQKALKSILLDFDHFTVCTIDSFLQTLLSGLARDLGYTAHFKVELSDKEVIEKQSTTSCVTLPTHPVCEAGSKDLSSSAWTTKRLGCPPATQGSGQGTDPRDLPASWQRTQRRPVL